MRIPNADKAIVSPEKLRDYLLSPHHPVGRFKAVFFADLGYSIENREVLERDLKNQILSQNAEEVRGFPHGKKYVVTAPVRVPSGKVVQVTSVWVILKSEDIPRFVTAYPGE